MLYVFRVELKESLTRHRRRSFFRLLLVLFSSALSLQGATHVHAADGERIAFVIGNSQYQEIRPLYNPKNDAEDVGRQLQTLGFRLHGGKVYLDLTKRQLQREYNRFVEETNNAEIAFLYFAGHGMQFDGEPHLLPVDVPDEAFNIVKSDSLSLNELLAQLGGRADLTVAVFDACREIPDYKKKVQRGLRGGREESWRGLSRPEVIVDSTLIAYSGGSGELVADGAGRNSPYTELLLKYLDKDTLAFSQFDVSDVFSEVSYQFRLQHNVQAPEFINQGVPPRRFYLTPVVGTDYAKLEGELGLTRLERQSVQEALSVAGHDVGRADGIWGARTRRGIKEWNTKRGYKNGEYLGAVGYKALLVELLEPSSLPSVEPVPEPESLVSVPASTSELALKRASYEPEMVSITGGRFMMGSSISESGRDDDEKQHEVTVRSFMLSKYEATFAEYDVFAKATGRKLPNDRGWGRDLRPVINVRWRDANAYAQWLSEQTGKAYRLPTEAEWEYAARAGGKAAYSWGALVGSNKANCDSCGSQWDDKKTAPVGSFAENDWSLYDLHGNVWEWTCSEYVKNYNGSESKCVDQKNDSGRAGRGGSWDDLPLALRAAYRYGYWPGFRASTIGFRLAQDN